VYSTMRLAPTHALLVTILSLWLTTSAWAGFDEGWDAYERGDYATALEEWLPVAEQGHAETQTNLGFMYQHGYGVPQDLVAAVKWYRLAAEQGQATAQFNLGAMYMVGDAVLHDFTEAAKWWRLAADQGVARALNNVGLMYANGRGVPVDYVEAHMWFDLAASKGDEDGRKNRTVAAKRMTPADISEAQRLAREWLEEHGERGGMYLSSS
jgi:TPR repeat protein